MNNSLLNQAVNLISMSCETYSNQIWRITTLLHTVGIIWIILACLIGFNVLRNLSHLKFRVKSKRASQTMTDFLEQLRCPLHRGKHFIKYPCTWFYKCRPFSSKGDTVKWSPFPLLKNKFTSLPWGFASMCNTHKWFVSGRGHGHQFNSEWGFRSKALL